MQTKNSAEGCKSEKFKEKIMREGIMNTSQKITIGSDELKKVLEPLIRKIIREELFKAVQHTPDIFFLSPDMPLYTDMKEIARRKAVHEIEFYSHDEVWNE
jgi:hypothetical protein